MTKDESTGAGLQAIKDGITAALDNAFDNGVASAPVVATADVQSQIDAAVASAQAALQPQIDALKASLSEDEAKLADMTALEVSVQEKLDKIKQLLA